MDLGILEDTIRQEEDDQDGIEPVLVGNKPDPTNAPIQSKHTSP